MPHMVRAQFALKAILMALAFLPAAVMADDAAPAKSGSTDEIPTVELTVTPAAAPVPALKYRFLHQRDLGVDVANDPRGEQTERPADASKWRAEFVRDRGDELVLQGVQFRAVCELKGVLVMLFTGLGELLGKFAGCALRPQKSN